MINNKEYLADNINEINKILSGPNIHEFFNIVFKEGISKYKEKLRVGGIYEIETYPAAKWFAKIQEIGNVICNKKDFWPAGISADVMLSQKIPVIKIKNIILTMKSAENIDILRKRPTKYMKQYSILNNGLTPQLEMVDYNLEKNLNELKLNLGAKYYGILAYKLGSDNALENMQVVFLSDKANEIVHTVDIPIIKLDDKIAAEDKSLKDKIEENKGESLKAKIGLK